MNYYVDGSGWNGKESKWCVYPEGNGKEPQIFVSNQKYTNNEAEYQGLIQALSYVKKNNTSKIIIYSDSQLIVNQVNGTYMVREARLKTFHSQATNLIKYRNVELRWIPREQNKAGVYIERYG